MADPKIITAQEFPFAKFAAIEPQTRKRGNQKKRTGNDVKYKNILTAFDIETTRIPEIDQSVMYVWQWAFGPELVVMGRTWEELGEFVQKLGQVMKNDERLIVWVHNLSYEFQFIRNVHEWKDGDVMAVKSRKVLRSVWDFLEFRCSYIHSNMSLEVYTDKMDAEHKKLTEKEMQKLGLPAFDYDKPRFSWTPLEDYEKRYCVNDVVGLVEALAIEMKDDGDNLYTVPLTSTGYVRRDAKAAVNGSRLCAKIMKEQLPDYEVYKLLREAFRGGNTHANRFFVGEILENVHSADRSSSYPDVQCNDRFPMGVFQRVKDCSIEHIMSLITKRHKAVLLRLAMLDDIRLQDPKWPVPYIPTDKCRNLSGEVVDNGRVLSADYLEITVTDVDLLIIMSEYTCGRYVVLDAYQTYYGKMPDELRKVTIDYYKKKTALKDVKGQEIQYTKSKNKLNSIFGMSAQDPVKPEFHYDASRDAEGKDIFYQNDDNPEELLEMFNKHAFLAYQHGVWITAWARYRLEEGIRMAGHNFVYCDTDSVKYLGEIDWRRYNSIREAASRDSGAFATDPAGHTHYMGVYEFEGTYDEFITWGAKIYAVKEDGKVKVTIAGVNKKKGGEELEKAGGLEALKPGFVFREAGGLESVYNDGWTEYTVEGRTIKIGPNICLRPSTYEVCKTRTGIDLCDKLDHGGKVIDNF